MTRDGRYTASYAAAVTAVSSVIGPIIPPSIPMVLYALVSDASIGFLFLGGVIPGLLMALSQMIIVAITARRKNFPVEKPVPLAQAAADHLGGLPVPDDAGRPARRHLRRRDDADRSGGGRGRLRASHLGRALSQRELARLLQLASPSAPARPPRSAC